MLRSSGFTEAATSYLRPLSIVIVTLAQGTRRLFRRHRLRGFNQSVQQFLRMSCQLLINCLAAPLSEPLFQRANAVQSRRRELGWSSFVDRRQLS